MSATFSESLGCLFVSSLIQFPRVFCFNFSLSLSLLGRLLLLAPSPPLPVWPEIASLSSTIFHSSRVLLVSSSLHSILSIGIWVVIQWSDNNATSSEMQQQCTASPLFSSSFSRGLYLLPLPSSPPLLFSLYLNALSAQSVYETQ